MRLNGKFALRPRFALRKRRNEFNREKYQIALCRMQFEKTRQDNDFCLLFVR